MIRNKVWLFVYGITFFSCSSMKNPKLTVATVDIAYDNHANGGSGAWYSYKIIGAKDSDPSIVADGCACPGAARGGHFKLFYDSLNLGHTYILCEEPIIPKGEPVIKTVGVILYAEQDLCSYEYMDTTSHKKVNIEQSYFKGTLEMYPELVEGAKFEVELVQKNHKIAKIYFDREIKKSLLNLNK